MAKKLAVTLGLYLGLWAVFAIVGATAQPLPDQPPTVIVQPAATPAAPTTQNTVTTTGPVESTTTISVGTIAGQVLTWVATVFGASIGTLLTAWLYRLFKLAGVAMTDAMRARLQEMVINGLNIGAQTAAADLDNKGAIQIKQATIQHAINYVQTHGVEELHNLGIDPNSNIAVDAIKARIATAIADANAPTPAILTPVAPANSLSASAMRT
jgi:hypothetical protein